MLRTGLIVGSLIGSAVVMPTAVLGIVIGFDGLRHPIQAPGGTAVWLIDLGFLFLGLGGVLGSLRLWSPSSLLRSSSVLADRFG